MLILKRLVLLKCLSWAIFLGLFSCAYHVGDSRSPQQTLHVFVPVLENVTVRPIDLNELTSSLRENLESVRGVIVVNNRSEADVVLLGKVIRYDRTWGPTAYKGTAATAAAGGLKEDILSASTTKVILGIELEKLNNQGERSWSGKFAESDLYEMSDRLELARGSAAAPQIHASREALLVKKLADRIFERARAQIVDDF